MAGLSKVISEIIAHKLDSFGCLSIYLCLRSKKDHMFNLKRGAYMLKKTYQKGFTVVELLIVIVVIGILAALVLNTFAGIQQKARDTERKTDINAVATQ